jgi:hypothetical protein
MMIEAMRMLREGAIGEVLVAKAWNIQRRGSIGHGKSSDPPSGLDYPLWLGPTPSIPYQSKGTIRQRYPGGSVGWPNLSRRPLGGAS